MGVSVLGVVPALTTFELFRVDQNCWVIRDGAYDVNDARNVVACVNETDSGTSKFSGSALMWRCGRGTTTRSRSSPICYVSAEGELDRGRRRWFGSVDDRQRAPLAAHRYGSGWPSTASGNADRSGGTHPRMSD